MTAAIQIGGYALNVMGPLGRQSNHLPSSGSGSIMLPAPEPPEVLCCSITLSLLEDPVLHSDGHGYSRVAIEDWLRRGNTSSPMSGEALDSTTLVPCHRLHSMVVEWCEANSVRTPVRK